MRKYIGLTVAVLMLLILISPAFAAMNNIKKVSRTQTVYSVLNWDGTVQNSSVVNWLRIDGDGELKIEDDPRLTEIVSLHPTAKFSEADGKSSWNIDVNGSTDLFYTGNTDLSLPVEIDIKFLLDGAQINSSEINGSSGELTFIFTFTNTLAHEEIISWTVGDKITEKLETIYTPMTIMVQADIPSDEYDELSASDAFQMTVGNNRKLMWTAFPKPTSIVEFSITDDNLKLPNLSISIIPKAPSFPIPEIDTALIEVMSSMGDTGELLDMMEDGNTLDMSSALENIGNLENMTLAIEGMVDSASSSVDGVSKLFDGYGQSLSQIRDGAKNLITLSENHKMILQMITDEMAKNSEGITASSEALVDANTATGKVSSNLFGIQFYLEDMQDSLKDLRKKTNDTEMLELISSLDTSVSKSLSKLEIVKGNADTATSLMKALSDGGTIDGIEIPALSETPEMMKMLDDTLSAIISGGEMEGQEIPGITTTIDGLKGISDGITMMLEGGEMEGNVLPAWNEIPKMITESTSNMDVFVNGGEINGITIPSQAELQEMINEFKVSLEQAEPLQEKMDEFSSKFRNAIDSAGGADKLAEATENTEEMLLGETAKFERMKELAKEYTSFVGNTPNAESSVLFVLKLVDSAETDNGATKPIESSQNDEDPNPYKDIEKARLYLLITAVIIIIVAIVVNWLYKRKHSDI